MKTVAKQRLLTNYCNYKFIDAKHSEDLLINRWELHKNLCWIGYYNHKYGAGSNFEDTTE